MTNGLFDGLLGADRVAALLDDAAWVRALLAVEVALTHAAAAHGLVAAADAERVEAAAATVAADLDPAELAAAAVGGGNPVIPLVRVLRSAAGSAGGAVHPGATSQDVMDTALVLLVRDAAAAVGQDLRGAADAAAGLAGRHRDTPTIARTLGQQALPTTFGLVAAGWCAGLDRSRDRLAAVVGALPVSFGGAAGTLAASHPHGPDVADTLADRLGLARQEVPWHTERTRIGELAGALGVAAGACAKPAGDLVALSATEVGEVGEAAPGDSSSMPHKNNPVAAVTARASARRAPGLVATLLAAMEHEHQRAAGAWHAEWPTVTGLLLATGGAAARLRTALTGLHVHPDAMARNLALTGPELVPNHAGEFVDRVLAARGVTAPRPDHVQSLARGLAVIRAFGAEHPRRTLSDVARATGLTRAAARRFLLTLAELGYVRTDGRLFELTPRVLELGYSYLSALTLPEVAGPHLETLSRTVGESVSVSVLDGADVVYVARVPASRIMTVTITIGTRFPAYATSMGRVLLAALAPDVAAPVLAGVTTQPLTARTVADPAALHQVLDGVRADGYCLVDEELEVGLRSLAVPLHDRSGAVVAAVNVSTHVSRGSPADLIREVLPELRTCAAAIEADLAAR